MSKLTDRFKQQIEDLISHIEQKSALEIVPVIIKRSSDYFAWRFFLSLLSGIVCLFICFLTASWGIETAHWLLSLAVSITVWFLLFWSPLLRPLLPRRVYQEAVQDEAAQWFLKEEVFNTKSRTGLLIFISEFERAAFILADKGLLKVLPESRWALLGKQLADDFSQMSAGESFLKALEQIDRELSSHFPFSGEDKNELSNRVRG